MASVKFIFEVSLSITLLLILTLQNTEAVRSGSSKLLSLLTDRLHNQEQPLIVIFGKDAALKNNRAAVDRVLSPETSDEGPVDLVQQILVGHNQPKIKPVPFKKSTLKPYQREERNRQRYRAQREKEERVLQTEDKNTLRSPIVKKLLRISNSLRCDAKDECQDKCSNKFYGKKQIKCQIQCETKYVCAQEEDYNDPCLDENDYDTCGSDNFKMSTKGEKLVTGKTGCKRC